MFLVSKIDLMILSGVLEVFFLYLGNIINVVLSVIVRNGMLI